MAAAAENLGITLPSVKMAVFRGGATLRDVLLVDAEPRRPSRDPLPAAEKEQPHGVA
jgi:hypothetical protein